MTCEEFELALPNVDDDPSVEQQSHLNSCSTCADLVADLDAISQGAKLLANTDEPSPRVWNSIEISLKQEGLIQEPKSERRRAPFLVPRRPPPGRLAWLIPVVAMLLLMFGVVEYQRSPGRVARQTPDAAMESSSQIADARNIADDQQLLEVVSQRAPAMRASYEANLRDVNSYIRDAEESAKIDPNDEQAQRDLMNAYEQRSMVYEMALDRSLP
jgi:hypothetical protein